MKWFIQDRILHGAYEKREEVPTEVDFLATQYEGAIPKRTGWNIPMVFIEQYATKHSFLRTYITIADYMIVYPRNDIQTKKHELLHAWYGIRPDYREQVSRLWESLTDKERDRVRMVLRNLCYPDNPAIQLDEFQAYYYTEKPSFFGIGVRPLRK
jgi:hypothetical protein